MMKNVYEILDEFEQVKTKKDRLIVIQNNLSKVLVDVLQLTYHPDYQWVITELPHNYMPKETPPGMAYNQLSTEIRRLYLFRKGHPTCDSLSPRKQNELLLQLLESIEPREAEVVMGIFKKDLGVSGLTYKFVKEAFPSLLP